MPKKVCSSCKAEVGPRKKVCSCGFQFENNIDQKSDNSKNESTDNLENAKSRQLSASSRRMKVCVAIPSGSCPVKPKNFKSFPHPEIEEDAVGDWAEKVFELQDGKYSIDAVKYWARQFWDINSKEFAMVYDYISMRLDPDMDDDLEKNL